MNNSSILNLLKFRLSLFFQGDKNGVSLNYLSNYTDGLFFTIDELCNSVKILPSSMKDYINEAEENYLQLQRHKKEIMNNRWDAGKNLFLLLYTYVRASKPKLIIETGVANGVTTNAIMNAAYRNQNDFALHSFDILPKAQEAYNGQGNWKFHLLNKPYKKNLVKITDKLTEVDMWVHDSNHGFRWQNMEYGLALSKLSAQGVLISDDIDASQAWSQKAKSEFKSSYILNDSRKFVGVAFS